MKALTIWQPWASLIMAGAKPYEFRGWYAPRSLIGERIVIHAGARPIRQAEVEDLIVRLNGMDPWTTALVRDKALPLLLNCLSKTARPLPLSAGLGTAKLGCPRVGADVATDFGMPAADSRRHKHSRFAWPMLDIEPFGAPITAKGAQGFWTWTGGDLERFQAEL